MTCLTLPPSCHLLQQDPQHLCQSFASSNLKGAPGGVPRRSWSGLSVSEEARRMLRYRDSIFCVKMFLNGGAP